MRPTSLASAPRPPGSPRSVVMLGASGAVGHTVLKDLLARSPALRITSLGRRILDDKGSSQLTQALVDVHEAQTYARHLPGHEAAICCLGVGQPSRVSDAAFVRTDKEAVLAFAKACQHAGVKHFVLLGSAGADPRARSLYLRTKGELREALVALKFERLSVFQPSLIVTPSNRYGVMQALSLALWPRLDGLLVGAWQQYRSVPVDRLGEAMVAQLYTVHRELEILHWRDFMALSALMPPGT